MKKYLIIASSVLAIGLFGAMSVPAQQAPSSAPAAGGADTQSSQSSLQSEAGEPRAATSVDTAPVSEKPAPAAAAPTGAPTPAPRATASAHGQAPPANAAKTANDRLELGTATVTGDREQPKVMYIVPWKKSDIGDLSGKPMNSLLDEALAPVDRDEFKRQVVYYRAVKSDASQNGAKPSSQQGEK
jgi:hypothetical protein